MCMRAQWLCHVRLSVTPWTVALQAPLSMEFSRQEYWNGLPFPFPGDLPDPKIEPMSATLQADSLLSKPCKSDNLVPVIQNLGKISQTVTKLNSANNKWL